MELGGKAAVLRMKGDLENCLAAGMNAYLSKPVDMNDLAALLRRYFPGRFAAPAAPRALG